ncbi:MAG: DUF4837 family protein [candidate division WOR-3 bacterium]
MKKFIFLILLISCSDNIIIFKGEFNTLLISAGSLKNAKRFLKKNFEIIQFTPREEKILEILDIDSLEKEERFLYRYYIIISTPNSKNFDLFKSIFGEVKRSGIYIRENPFLNGSSALGIYGQKEEEILKIISEKKDTIFNIFYNRILKNLRELSYFPGKRKDLSEKIFEKTGIKIEVPVGFNIFKEGENFIIINAHYPDRFILFWKINKKINLLPEKIIRLRDSFAKDVYAGDSVIRKFVNYQYKNINGKRAIYIYGAWGNYNLKVGGGFESLVFENNGNTIFIDIGVHEPRKWKLKYLKMMESWAFYPDLENGKNN